MPCAAIAADPGPSTPASVPIPAPEYPMTYTPAYNAYHPSSNADIRAAFDGIYTAGDKCTNIPALASSFSIVLDEAIYEERHAAIKRLADVTPGAYDGTLLDICSGSGNSTLYWPNKRIVGVDISPVGVKWAQEHYPEAHWFVGEVETFELPEGTPEISCIVNSESLEHWIDPGAAMRHIRSLVPEGTPMLLSTPNRDSWHCRNFRKLGLGEPPVSCDQHVREFGYRELIEEAPAWGWTFDGGEDGCMLLPTWACEHAVGHAMRQLMDNDAEVVKDLATLGRTAPVEYRFCMVLRLRAS
jgi:SAM-dependent methyltransferase